MAAYCKTKVFFEKHRDVPSFAGIDQECTDLIENLATELETRVYESVSCETINPLIERFYVHPEGCRCAIGHH